MKTKWIALIGIGSALFILIFVMVVFNIILEITWWLLFWVFVGEFILGITVGLVMFFKSLSKKSPPKSKEDIKTLEERAKREMKFDEDNPDNLEIIDRCFLKIGKSGVEKTPILWINGRGSEMNKRVDILINVNEPQQEFTRVIGKEDDYIRGLAKALSDEPPEDVTTERSMYDPFGKITGTIRETRPVTQQQKIEKEQKEVEETNAL